MRFRYEWISGPLSAKIMFFGSFLATVLIQCIGIKFIHFVPSPDFIQMINTHQELIGVSVFLITAYFAFQLKAGGDGFRVALLNNPIGKALFCALIAILVISNLKTVIPGLLAEASSGPQATEYVRVLSVKSHSKIACPNNATAEWITSGDNAVPPEHQFMVCHIPGRVLSGLKPGDTLKLSGRRTPFGLRITDYQKG